MRWWEEGNSMQPVGRPTHNDSFFLLVTVLVLGHAGRWTGRGTPATIEVYLFLAFLSFSTALPVWGQKCLDLPRVGYFFGSWKKGYSLNHRNCLFFSCVHAFFVLLDVCFCVVYLAHGSCMSVHLVALSAFSSIFLLMMYSL